MEKYLQVLENALIRNGYSFTVGCKKSQNEYLYVFWNDKSPIAFYCSFNELGIATDITGFGCIQCDDSGEKVCLAGYSGFNYHQISESIVLSCIEVVEESVKWEMERAASNEEIGGAPCLGNHTTDVETYFQMHHYDYTL